MVSATGAFIPDPDESKGKVELFISCAKLKDKDFIGKSDPYCKIFMMTSGVDNKWKEVGKTETIENNLNPQFKKSIILDYIFEKEQKL